MKPLLLLLALAGTACQPQAADHAAAGAGSETPARPATVASSPATKAPADTLVATGAAGPALAAADIALLRQYDLAPLWANHTEVMKAHPTMEGFYGPTYYRISFYFTRVVRDAGQANLFHVEGLDRYKKVVTPFSGTITVRAIRPFTKGMVADVDTLAQVFTAAGQFKFAEVATTKGAGVYYGRALLDFAIDRRGHLDQAYDMTGNSLNPTKGCGLLFSGYQLINQTNQRHSVAFANFYGAVVPTALNKLRLGDRSEEINPNLAKLGWNDAWENDEWWADSPKPHPSL